MASPVVEGSLLSTNGGGTTVTSHIITKPTGVVSGELLVIVIEVDVDNNTLDISVPAGWTQELEISVLGTNLQFLVVSKRADGTEAASETFTTSDFQKSVGVYMRLSNAAGIETVGISDDHTTTTLSVTPTGVNVSNDSLVIGFAGIRKLAGDPASTATAGWSEVQVGNQGTTILGVFSSVVGSGTSSDITIDFVAAGKGSGIQFSVGHEPRSAIMMGAPF